MTNCFRITWGYVDIYACVVLLIKKDKDGKRTVMEREGIYIRAGVKEIHRWLEWGRVKNKEEFLLITIYIFIVRVRFPTSRYKTETRI